VFARVEEGRLPADREGRVRQAGGDDERLRGRDKPWDFVVKDIDKPRIKREARVIPKTSIECKSCGKQAVCMATIGDVEKYKCECGWWAELRDGVILKQGEK